MEDVLLHGAIMLLYKHHIPANDAKAKEEIIKRNMSADNVQKLERLMKKYEANYASDFNVLHQRICEDMRKELFYIA